NFVPDPRPDVANVRCMTDCRDPANIRILSEAAPAEVEEAAEDLQQPEPIAANPGKATYDQFCSICHDVGVAGAPKLADAQGWAPRIENGLQSMIDNAINGMSSDSGVMPPKGGFAALSDDEVGAAVEFMVEALK
ncbi:MAG: c-type cytochrome, partial [Gammaproteobacteria bacterium]|nr:c-type cytochrome [Gammaproteobacteria bacterium]